MNRDQFKGNWRQFKGEVKKKWGQLTDNDLVEAEGDYDKFLGVEVERWAEDWCEKNSHNTTEAGNRI
jgi:uncharacterized protein YjbJ (UPF0337 family)